MKVLIIELGGHNIFAYGTRMLSAYLKQHKVDVDLMLIPFIDPDRKKFFSPHWKFYDEKLINKIIAPVPDFLEGKDYGLIGISLTSNFFDHARMITGLIKKKYQTPIVWGGVHPTVRAEECLQYADIVVRGEGEDALLQLVRALETNTSLESVGNLAYKAGGDIKFNPLNPLIQDLDALPMQDFDYSTHYLAYQKKIMPMTEELVYKVMASGYGDNSYGYSTMANRGCPNSCSYCINSTLKELYRGKGNFIRKRSYQNVIEELTMIKRRLPKLTYLLFSDETFLMGKKIDWIKDFCELYKEKFGLPFYCCFSPEDVSEESLRLLSEAGLFNAEMGIQSCSNRTLIEDYKRQENTNLIKAAHILNKFSDRTMPIYDVILDNPYESDEDRKDIIRFLLKLPRPFELELFSLTWFPGATITEKGIADGHVKDFTKEVYRKHFQAYDRSNYYNLLISLVPYFDRQLITDLLEKNDRLHYLGVRAFIWLWNYSIYVSSTWPYQALKKVLVNYGGFTPPVYAANQEIRST